MRVIPALVGIFKLVYETEYGGVIEPARRM